MEKVSGVLAVGYGGHSLLELSDENSTKIQISQSKTTSSHFDNILEMEIKKEESKNKDV